MMAAGLGLPLEAIRVGAEDGGVVLEYTVAQLAHNYPKHRRRSPRERSERRRQLL